jgi:hypothetical protein
VIVALAVNGSLLLIGALIGATVMWMVMDRRRWRRADARVDAEHASVLRRWRPATDMASRLRGPRGHRRPWTVPAWPQPAPAPASDPKVRGDASQAAWEARDVDDPQAVVQAIFNQATVRRAVGVAAVERPDRWDFFDTADAVLREKTPAAANDRHTQVFAAVPADGVPL